MEQQQQQPDSIPVLDFVSARAAELNYLENAIGVVTSSFVTGLQRLPRRQRRRAASHNPKRLPKRLRQGQFDAKLLARQSKRISRLYRRRCKRRLLAYRKRSARCMWLQTHVWHAKRFHMTERWGCRLALRPTDKMVRPCQRAAAKACLLHDSSYWRASQLTGTAELLVSCLVKLLAPHDAVELRRRLCCQELAAVQLSVVAYSLGACPAGCIGPVTLLPMPATAGSGGDISLLLWYHPAIAAQLEHELGSAMPADAKLENLAGRFCLFRLLGPASMQALDKLLCKPGDTSLSQCQQQQQQQQQQWQRWQTACSSRQHAAGEFFSLLCQPPVTGALRTRRDLEIVARPQAIGQRAPPAPSAAGCPLLQYQHRPRVRSDNGEKVEGQGDKEKLGSIPIVLWHCADSSSCSSWLLAAPLRCGRQLWLSLVGSGMPVAGQRELRRAQLEAEVLSYPAAFLDSPEGVKDLAEDLAADAGQRSAGQRAAAKLRAALTSAAGAPLLRDRRLLSLVHQLLAGRLPRGRVFNSGHLAELRPELREARLLLQLRVRGSGRLRPGAQLLACASQGQTEVPLGHVTRACQSLNVGQCVGEAVVLLAPLLDAAANGETPLRVTVRAAELPKAPPVACAVSVPNWLLC